MENARPSPRHGFTQVELLVVILIISLLMALVIPAVFAAKNKAQEAQITLEISQLAAALEQYKNARAQYPPSKSSLVKRHVRRAFSNPKVEFSTSLSEAEYLVFWLGGYWDEDQQRMTGFFADKRYPFTRIDDNDPITVPPKKTDRTKQRERAYYQFDVTRLTDSDSDGFPVYLPQGRLLRPFVYFAAEGGGSYSGSHSGGSGNGVCHPYATRFETKANPTDPDVASAWVNPGSFQIISAGLDNNYGKNSANKRDPIGTNYDDGDEDNLTSFTRGSLGDEFP